MHWKYKEVLHIHGDVKVVRKKKKLKKISITSSFLTMTSWSRVPFQYDKIPLQYLKKKTKNLNVQIMICGNGENPQNLLKHKFRL